MDYLINLDWLAFSVHLALSPHEKDVHDFEFSCPAGYRLVEFSGTNIYKRRMIVYTTDGEKVLTLLFEPHSKILDPSNCLVEVSNAWLYRGARFALDLVGTIHNCSFSNWSRIDVCCDFPMDDTKRKLVQQMARHDIYVAGKRESAIFFDIVTNQSYHRSPKCFNWGSKYSSIKWKLYNKSLEIYNCEGQQVKDCQKPYIEEQWRELGWDTSNIWRLEVSISSASSFEFHGSRINYQDIFERWFFEDLFWSNYTHRFITRRNEGHKDHTNDTRIWLLGNPGERNRVSRAPASNEQLVVEYVSCLRAAMAQREKPEVLANEKMLNLWTNTAKDVVKLGHLEGYFLRTYGTTIDKIKSLANGSIIKTPLGEDK